MNDARDDALAAVLDRAAIGIEATPGDRLPEVIRRGTRKRRGRFTVIVAALTAFVGVVGWMGLSFPKTTQRIPADVADWRTFASLEDNGWTIQVPPPWTVQELPACRNAPDRIGVIVTNVEFEFRNPGGERPQCEDLFDFDGFPREGVALAFMPVEVRTGGFFPTESVLPLEPDLMAEIGGIRRGPNERFSSIRVGNQYLAVVGRWVGTDSSRSDVEILDRMLGSLRVRGAPQWVEAASSSPNLRVALTHPEGWKVTPFRRLMIIDAPQPILMVTTPGVREGYSRCLGGPFGEFTTIGRLGVVVAISDATTSWGAASVTRPRPSALRPPEAKFDDVVRCRGEVRRLSFYFKEAGRPIVVNVLVSTAYLREQPQILWHILDSIEIEKV